MRLPSLVREVLDFCYPGRCACCDSDTTGGAQLCPPCETDLHKFETAAACSWCGKPLTETGAPCPYCFGEGIPHYDRIVRLGVFEEPLKHLIHQMKY